MMMGCISLEVLKLSNNSFHATLPTKSNLIRLSSLSLDNNDFLGEISRGFFNSSFLQLFDVSSNPLMGQIPYCFCKLNKLLFLDHSQNKIGPTLPPCANLKNMEDNKISSPIPPWISLLSKLMLLLLKGNQLEDSIPLSFIMTLRREVSLMDDTFSMDRFWTFWGCSPEPYSYENQLSVYLDMEFCFETFTESEEIEFITKSRSKSYMENILYFMSRLDLSGNKLTSVIPPEIGNLSGIHTLNLSYNQLTGSIPQTFSNLKEIESLDLSHNGLTDQIPTQMVRFQFATFEQINYEGNPLLCGLLLERSCTPTSAPPAVTPPVSNNRGDLLWCFGGSYGVAFLGIVSVLYLNSYYPEVLFYFIEKNAPFLQLKG
ncbi:hypothetical protein PVL29_014416 [Vitis rotundifolia]|uniref:Uncharacterized protein n=1 Tax=Vitis rotundifolia TaxID=103349 RepID=A0AA39DLE3_VITRO|nr:hypothetical protein PVL29_014416 [Vitis rotundifolia]